MSALTGGFADPARDSARAFRGCMNAMARPGEIKVLAGAVPPAPVSVAAGVLLLTLCDGTTGVFLAGRFDTSDVREWLVFHTGAALVPSGRASFVVGDWHDLAPLSQFALGTADYPDRSATVIVEQSDLVNAGAVLTGPGIQTQAALNLPELTAFQHNAALFPLGLDFYFTAGDLVAALPRSTRVSEGAV